MLLEDHYFTGKRGVPLKKMDWVKVMDWVTSRSRVRAASAAFVALERGARSWRSSSGEQQVAMVTANQSALLTAGALAVAGSVYLLLASRGKKARVKYIIGKVNYQADSVPASLRSSGKVCAAGACDARAAALCSGGLVRAGACSDRRPARHLV